MLQITIAFYICILVVSNRELPQYFSYFIFSYDADPNPGAQFWKESDEEPLRM